MKGKLWELGPFFIAAALALYILFGLGVGVRQEILRLGRIARAAALARLDSLPRSGGSGRPRRRRSRNAAAE